MTAKAARDKTFEDCYRIPNWDREYENNRTREIKKLRFVYQPNSHDGLRFGRLMQRPDGLAIYGAWCLIVQVASKCPTRGVLHDGHPLTAEDLAIRTRAPQAAFEAALQLLSSPAFGWILAPACGIPAAPRVRAQARARALDKLTLSEENEGKEGKEGKEYGDASASPTCSETAVGRSERRGGAGFLFDDDRPEAPPDQVLMTFPCDGPRKTWDLTATVVDALQRDFPSLNVLAICRMALAWIEAKPHRRKTANGMRAFLVNWLCRRVDEHGGHRNGHAAAGYDRPARGHIPPRRRLEEFER